MACVLLVFLFLVRFFLFLILFFVVVVVLNFFFLIFEVLISISDWLVAGLSVIYFETFSSKS